MKVLKEVLKENNMNEEEWNEWKKQNQSNILVKERLEKLDQLALSYKKNEKLKLMINAPPELTMQKFEIIHKKIILSYNYILQIEFQKIKNLKVESDSQKGKSNIDYNEIQEELEKRKIILLNEIGIHKKAEVESNIFYNDCWMLALHNFNQDENFVNRRQEVSILSQFLSKKIKEGVYIEELQNDPISKSSQDLDELFKLIATRNEAEDTIKTSK